MSTEISDLFVKGVSNCCDAKVYEGGRCALCKENCETVTEEEAHLEAVKSGDEDPDNCGICNGEARRLYELSHDL